MGNKNEKNTEQLQRGLKGRHLSMIAIGGTIGTGLFFASGSAVNTAGPGGAFVAYAIMGIVVYFMMTSLGEMATLLPIPGAFKTYADRFISPAWGFTNGWCYWFGCAMTVAAELVAGSVIIKYWFPDSNSTMWAVLFMAILLALNLFSVKSFGEAEYWFAGIKVVVTIIFLIIGTLMIVGIMKGNEVGFSNWTLDAGDGRKAPFVGGFSGIIFIFLIAGFSFSNTEIVGLSAAESENPERDVPKAIKQVFWRILIFYIGAIFIIGTLVPFTDPDLLNGNIDNVAASPFTLIFKHAGFAAAASLMNAVILTSVLSCGNSSLYCASRILNVMGASGDAPKYFAKISKHGVPVRAVIATAVVASTSFLSSMLGDGKIYIACYTLCGIAGFYNWLTISVAHYRFRRAFLKQGHDLSELKYKSPFFPYGQIFAIAICIVVIFTSNYWVFQEGNFTWFDFITSYALIPVALILYYGYSHKKKCKIIPLEECDFTIPEGVDRTKISAIDM